MSAYIVDDSTIHKLVSTMWSDVLAGPDSRRIWRHVFETGAPSPYSLDTPADREALGMAMRQLCERSVSQRYPNEPVDGLPGPAPYAPYRHAETLPPQPIAVVKLLDCYLYQSCEGDAVNDPLFKALEAARDELTHRIMRQTKEYEKASWG